MKTSHATRLSPDPLEARDFSLSTQTEIRHSGRQILRYGLGGLWILDGLLQAQPNMFTTDFYAWYPPRIMESVLQTAADDQPAWLAAVMKDSAHIWGLHPILFNVGAILIQLLIGVLILFGRFGRVTRSALWLSIVWGAAVWVFGEGMGGILTGSTYFDGAPGAVLLYVIGAMLLLMPAQRWQSPDIPPHHPVAVCSLLVVDGMAAGHAGVRILAGGRLVEPVRQCSRHSATRLSVRSHAELHALGRATVHVVERVVCGHHGRACGWQSVLVRPAMVPRRFAGLAGIWLVVGSGFWLHPEWNGHGRELDPAG